MNVKKVCLVMLVILLFTMIVFGVSSEVENLIIYYHNTLDLEESIKLSDNIKPARLSNLLKAYFFLADSVEKYYGKSESYVEKLIKDVDNENKDLYEVVNILKIWRFDSITRLDGKFEKLLSEFPKSLVVILEAMRFYHYNFTHYFYEPAYENLLRLFEKAKELRPDVATPSVWVINAMKIRGVRNKEKLENIIRSSLDRADSFVLRDFLAKFYFEAKDFYKASENSKIALDMKENAEDLYILGISLWMLQKVDESQKILEKLVDIEDFKKLNYKKQTRVYRTLGNIYENKEELEKAIEFYKLAVRKDSNDPEALKSLGMIYLKTDDPDRETYTRYYLNLALKVRPNWPEVEEVLDEINRKFVQEALIKYMFPILSAVVVLLILLEIFNKIKHKKELKEIEINERCSK